MRIGKIGWLIVLALALGLGWQFWPRVVGIFGWSFTEDVSGRSVFYRLLAKYQHGDEVIDFNVVVGCNVRITRYGDGDKSYDAFRDPVVFAKKTQDGGAVWQLIPDACQGHTTGNGEIPQDFLPGAIWFDHAEDEAFGIAYVTEDAFESPSSVLKFLGARIDPGTGDDWVEFQPTASQNLIDPRPFSAITPAPPAAEVRANLWNKNKLVEWTRSSFECRAVHRYHLTDPAGREAVRRIWPASRPEFWIPTSADAESISKHLYGKANIDGHRSSEYFHFGAHKADGFPTRARGGMVMALPGQGQLPPVIFPMRAEDGVPWATPALANADVIRRDVEIAGKRGFAYCYTLIAGRGALEDLHVPGYAKRKFVTYVDAKRIFGEENNHMHPSIEPHLFFERDEYFYALMAFGLN